MQIRKTLIVFSSSKSIQVAERIKEALSKEFETTIWNQGFFDGSHLPPVWTFLKNLMCYDFAAIVLGVDDIMEVPDFASSGKQIKTTYIPKDNVVFELGAVMARIGPQKTFVFKPRNPSVKIPSYFDNPDPEKIMKGSDIEKITTFVEYNHMEDLASVDEACERICSSGLTVNAFCSNEGIAPSKFYYWQKRIRASSSHPLVSNGFLPLTIDTPDHSSLGFTSAENQLEITYPEGTILRLRGNITVEDILTLLKPC